MWPQLFGLHQFRTLSGPTSPRSSRNDVDLAGFDAFTGADPHDEAGEGAAQGPTDDRLEQKHVPRQAAKRDAVSRSKAS